jgi:hypothetical protein
MAINGQTQPQKFSLYRYREGKSDLEHGKWFKRQDQGGPNKRTMQRLLLTLGLVDISLRSSLYAEDPIRYDPVSRQVIESRLQKYVGNDKQREDTLRQMFSQAGHLGWSGARHARIACRLLGRDQRWLGCAQRS